LLPYGVEQGARAWTGLATDRRSTAWTVFGAVHLREQGSGCDTSNPTCHG
jgi:hypothetical protein